MELKKKKEYGEWMVVSRRKPNSKMRFKHLPVEQSQTGEASSEPSSISRPRVVDQNKRDGKRKASHMQPTASINEVSMSFTSNLNKPNRGKGTKGVSSRTKTNQKVVNLV